MLKAHLNAVENQLLVTSRIPANSGHPLHKGTPRESFIKQFLLDHLPETVAIGTGEIIDSNSTPNQLRNQYDIVIYRKNYPKLDFGGGISGFLIESVIATIEVKSTLTEAELITAAGSAKNAKNLQKHVISSFQTGYIPPSILNYVVAYDGPANLSTVFGWLPNVYASVGLALSPLSTNSQERIATPSKSIDAIFILGRGFLYFDNTPLGFISDAIRIASPNSSWVFANSPTENLLLFFLFLLQSTQNVEGQWLDSIHYLSNVNVQGIQFM
jgi:hypothetical protein